MGKCFNFHLDKIYFEVIIKKDLVVCVSHIILRSVEAVVHTEVRREIIRKLY